MEKKLVIIIVFILSIISLSLSLYYTYAIDVTIDKVENNSNADLTYNVNLLDPKTTTITVKAGETKYFDIFVTNANDAIINYSLVYEGEETEGITIAQVDTSKNKVSELIESNTTHQINMVIVNETTSDYTYDIVPIVGYEKGGDLIVPSGYTKIEDVYYIPKHLDNSGANPPRLTSALIPVTYYDGKWVKADIKSSNSNYKWYDYDEKKVGECSIGV